MSWNPIYILPIVFSTLVDYVVAIKMDSTNNKTLRKSLLFLSLLSNLGLLFTFKYFNFFNKIIEDILLPFGYEYSPSVLTVLLPVGISFYTFQTLSYTIDVFLKKQRAQYHFGKFALFVSFFPQLVAGPIERSTQLLPQFDKTLDFDYKRITSGLKQMFWGLFKKIVIADRVAVIVNQVFNNATDYEGFSLVVGTIFFSFQIYCDFSGYSDIAIGCARVFGFNLMTNFNKPYYAKSISEFWQRWHISLSTWFRDYVYIPLGGNRTMKWRWYFNLFITFFISGIWHGANWTFIIWGAIHGVYLILAIVFRPIVNTLYNKLSLDASSLSVKVWQATSTYFLVCLAWIFFRANSVSDAYLILQKIFTMDFNLQNWIIQLSQLGIDKNGLVIAIFSIIIMEVVHWMDRHESFLIRLNRLSTIKRWSIYYAFLIYLLFFGTFGEQDFIYFQF
ncbi:MAG: MBOAT family O-acyltransferase [Bacteroidota bacterium]